MEGGRDYIKKFFPTAEDRRKLTERLIREAEEILSKFDPELVETVRRRRETGESLKEIYEALGRDPAVLNIGLQLAVIKQALRENDEYS